jgi:hypothetical protein
MVNVVVGTSEKDNKEWIGMRTKSVAKDTRQKLTGVLKRVPVELTKEEYKRISDLKRTDNEKYQEELRKLI